MDSSYTVIVPAPDYESGGMSSWVRSIFIVAPDGTTRRLSKGGELTPFGLERVNITRFADVRRGDDGEAVVRVEPGECVRVVEGHPDFGESGRWSRWEVSR